MFCRFCGCENQDKAAFCKKCGKKIDMGLLPVQQESIPEAEAIQTSCDSQSDASLICPYCGSANCHPVVKTDVKTSGGGYSFWNGCCGLILLGPAGLLCGACGSSVKTKVRSEMWWICQKCGKEFMSKKSALEKANISIRTAAIYSLIISSVVGYSLGESEFSTFWVFAIAALIIVGLWGSIPMAMTENSGLQIDQLLTTEEKSSFYTKFYAFCAASIIGGFLLGIAAIE